MFFRIISKKRKYLLLIIAAVLIASLSGCESISLFSRENFKPSKILSMQIISDDGQTLEITDENDLNFYIEALNTVNPDILSIETENMAEYRLLVNGKKDRHSKDIPVYINKSLDKKEIFIELNGKLGKIDPFYFPQILLGSVFESLYENRAPSGISLLSGSGDSIQLEPSGYEWNHKKTDSKFYSSIKSTDENQKRDKITMISESLPQIESPHMPDTIKLDFFVDNEIVYTASDINAPCPLGDGLYQCVLELSFSESDNRDFYGSAVYMFDIQIDKPPEFKISSDWIYPGELLVITANNINEDETVTIKTDIDFNPNVFGEGSERVILLPVSYYHQAGKTYKIEITAGNASKTFDVELRDKEFIIQYLKIDQKIAAETRNDKSAQEVAEKVDPLRPVCDPEKYWEGTFIQPVEGGRVSPKDFGKRRYVNNAPTSYRHNGLDIGQDQGTPIKAVNNGRVLLAEYLIGTGYTVIIEHGYGLKSWYYHMVELNTEKDAMVKKGDIIGYVGSTGFSTGPHLHLSISVNNIYVNPMPFFEEGVPLQ